MPQQKGIWIYTTRIHINDTDFSKSNASNVTSACLWTGVGGDGGKRMTKSGTKATALVSHIVVPQPTQGAQSMKLRSRNPSLLPSAPNYDDPAFSPDPLSNPLFSSNQLPAWNSPPGPGHPTLKKQRPVDAEDFNPPQPPNTPAIPEPNAAPDNRTKDKTKSTASSTINSPSFTDSSSSSPSTIVAVPSTLPSRDPSSSQPHVRPEVDMPHDAHHLPPQRSQHPSSSKPEPKKRQGFLSKLLGSSSTDSSYSSTSSTSPAPRPSGSRNASTMLRVHQPQPPPYNMGPRPIPVQHHRATQSAPEVHRSDRPVMPSRAKTTGTAEAGRIVPLAGTTSAAGPAADDRWLRQDLDRIDELDETSPFGAAVHHGGPYEAISRFVQKDSAPKPYAGPAHVQQPGGRSFMMSGDIYRDAQLLTLQQGSLNLKPGQVLSRDFAPYTEPSRTYPYPHLDTQPQQSRHHEHYPRHAYLQPSVPMLEPRSSFERSGSTQIALSVPQAGSLGNYPVTEPSSSLTLLKRRRTPSPTAATTHSNDDDNDAGIAIGMALIGDDQNNSHASDTTVTAVNSDAGSSPNIPVKITLREPTDVDEPSPPPYMPDPPDLSASRVDYPRAEENQSQGPVIVETTYREEPFSTREPMPHLSPVAAPTSSRSRHTSWHPQSTQLPPAQVYSSRQETQNLQPHRLPQQHVAPVNPGLSRSSTYALGSSGLHTDRLALASSLKAGGSTPPPTTPNLRDRESDTRSIQQSIMTTSNASGASSRSQGSENPRRNRYLPKRLIMPTPLQPALQNQATAHQVRFDPQANSAYPRDRSSPKGKRSSLAPQSSRAQDIPMAPSNGKLRKRVSLVGGLKTSPKEQVPPVAAVSFSANIVSADRTARSAEKPHKKVLSKRK